MSCKKVSNHFDFLIDSINITELQNQTMISRGYKIENQNISCSYVHLTDNAIKLNSFRISKNSILCLDRNNLYLNIIQIDKQLIEADIICNGDGRLVVACMESDLPGIFQTCPSSNITPVLFVIKMISPFYTGVYHNEIYVCNFCEKNKLLVNIN